jgi:hypothetical protein
MVKLNPSTVFLQEKLPPTDGRLRPDQRALENGDYDLANAEKLRLETKQRAVSVFLIRNRGGEPDTALFKQCAASRKFVVEPRPVTTGFHQLLVVRLLLEPAVCLKAALAAVPCTKILLVDPEIPGMQGNID